MVSFEKELRRVSRERKLAAGAKKRDLVSLSLSSRSRSVHFFCFLRCFLVAGIRKLSPPRHRIAPPGI